jgi:hypothetical protein
MYCKGENDLDIEFLDFVRTQGIINYILKPSLVSRYTRIRIYMILATPTLSYGTES